MAHHFSESISGQHATNPLMDELAKVKDDLRKEMLGLGATGQYLHGKLCEQDEGEIKIAIAADPAKGVVLIDFGKPIASIGFTPKQANDIANMLIEKAFACRGIV